MSLPRLFAARLERIHKTDIFSLRFIKFCAVGGANVAVDFLCYTSGIWLGLSPYFSRTLSWITAAVFSYTVNKRWTFKAEDKGFAPFLRFCAVNALSLSLGLVLLFVFKSLGAGDSLGFVLTVPFTMVVNYLGYRFWSFQHVDAKP